jgi:hypothetical protein
MSIVSALDGVDSILAIIKKGAADPATKLEAILPLAERLRNDLQDLGDEAYASEYVSELPPITFDMEQAISDFLEVFRKQEYNNLYAYYDLDIMSDEKDPHVRNAIAQALVKLAVELKREPSSVWTYLIQTEGVISEAVE